MPCDAHDTRTGGSLPALLLQPQTVISGLFFHHSFSFNGSKLACMQKLPILHELLAAASSIVPLLMLWLLYGNE